MYTVMGRICDPRSGSVTQARIGIGKGSDNEWRIGKRIGIADPGPGEKDRCPSLIIHVICTYYIFVIIYIIYIHIYIYICDI